MKKAIIICGAPAAGKSTYAKKLASERGAMILDIDEATEVLVRLGMELAGKDPDDRDSPFFKKSFREPIYCQMFSLARLNLPYVEVLIVGPFTRELNDPTWPERLEKHLGCEVEVHFVYAEPDIRRKRMIERANPRDQSKLERWSQHLEYYRGCEFPVCKHARVDTSS